jgi:hypothetical protein
MAHKGHFGPVAYRRDLNLNVVSNDAGWLRGYIVFFSLLPGGIAGVLAGKFLRSFPDSMTALNTESWIGTPKLITGRFWHFEIDVSILPGGSKYDVEFRLYEALTNLVWRVSFTREQDEARIPGFSPTPSTVYWNPAYWDQQPNALSIVIAGMAWSDYPP